MTSRRDTGTGGHTPWREQVVSVADVGGSKEKLLQLRCADARGEHIEVSHRIVPNGRQR